MKKTKVLVCGATGFIGRNIIERLSERNDLVIVGTYFKTEPDKFLAKNKKIALFKVDLTNEQQVNKIIKGQDVVIQAAAVTSGAKDIVIKPYLHVTDNAIMNSLIFKSCFDHKVKHLVFFSCTVMYPNQKRAVKEDDFNYQITDKYFGVGWTKVYLEKMCEFYSRISNTKYTVIRHTNIYGPYDKYDLEKSHFFGATITKVLTARDNKIVVWGDGSEKRDLLYISDLVDFIETILRKQRESFELVNLGLGRAFSVREVIKKIIKISGKKLKLEFDKSKPTIKFNLAINIDKAYKKYHFKPKVSLDEGIKKTLAWYDRNIL